MISNNPKRAVSIVKSHLPRQANQKTMRLILDYITKKVVKWYHCVCGQREQSKGTTVYVDKEGSQMKPLQKRINRAVKYRYNVCRKRE